MLTAYFIMTRLIKSLIKIIFGIQSDFLFFVKYLMKKGMIGKCKIIFVSECQKSRSYASKRFLKAGVRNLNYALFLYPKSN